MNPIKAVLKPVLRPVITQTVALLQCREVSPRGVLNAYREGRFPMPGRFGRVAWHTPDQRAVMPLEKFHVQSRLARMVRQGKFEITYDKAFDDVVDGCA